MKKHLVRCKHYHTGLKPPCEKYVERVKNTVVAVCFTCKQRIRHRKWISKTAKERRKRKDRETQRKKRLVS